MSYPLTMKAEIRKWEELHKKARSRVKLSRPEKACSKYQPKSFKICSLQKKTLFCSQIKWQKYIFLGLLNDLKIFYVRATILVESLWFLENNSGLKLSYFRKQNWDENILESTVKPVSLVKWKNGSQIR